MGAEGVEILLVDDVADVRDLVGVIAQMDDRVSVVHEVPDGAAAIDLVRQQPGIDVVVLDYEMPGGNGVDVLPRLRELLPGATIVLYTSNVSVAEAALAAGADDVIDKTTTSPLVMLDDVLDPR